MTFKNAIHTLVKRPFIIVYMSLVMLVVSIVDYNIPTSAFGKIFLGVGDVEGGDVSVTIVNVLRILIGFILKPATVIEIILYIIGISTAFGILFSGYLSVARDTVNGSRRVRSSFLTGFREHYLKIIMMTFVVLVVVILFAFFFVIAAIPAMVLTSAVATGSNEYLLAAILVDIVSVAALFFGLMFFRIYIIFWYTSVISGKKRAFIEGKRIADANFWSMVIRMIILDLVFSASILLLNLIGNAMIVYVLKWVFNTIFFAFMITYIFALLKAFENNRESIEQE